MLKILVIQLSTSYFSKQKTAKDTSNVLSIMVERKGPIEHFFAFSTEINQ